MIASQPTTTTIPKPTTFSGYTPPPKFPAFAAIKQKKWKEILTRYAEGERDKETVCARTAYMAALKGCKGWPAGSFDELVNEGYACALRRWEASHLSDPYSRLIGDDPLARLGVPTTNVYDPTKASANGIAGFLYKVILLTLRKIAQERFTIHGKRIHKPTDVLPKIVALADEQSIDRAVWRAPVTGAAVVDYDGKASHHGGGRPLVKRDPDAPLNRFGEAEAPAHRRGGKLTPDHVKAPHSPSGAYLEHAANEQARIRISDLLLLLPKAQAELVALHFGVNGVDRARTVKELAVDAGCSVSSMYRRLELLIPELQRRAKVTAPSKGARDMSLAFRVVTGLGAAIGRDALVTVALVFTRIAAAGQASVLQATLARELHVSDAALSRALRILELRGLVSTNPDPADGRHRVIRLTAQGAEVIQTMAPQGAARLSPETEIQET